MALPLYLAMTAAEIGGIGSFPEKMAYMACHFSPYGTALTNLPDALPPESMLILNDRIPCCGHDAAQITAQLLKLSKKLEIDSILLDFQRPGCKAVAGLVQSITAALSCPVGVALPYAENLDCPVFLPPVPPDVPVMEYLQPWQGREIWLETALDAIAVTLTGDGATTTPLPYFDCPDNAHRDAALLCHYTINLCESVRFTLCRTTEDLKDLLCQGAALGVTKAVGLWQELCK